MKFPWYYPIVASGSFDVTSPMSVFIGTPLYMQTPSAGYRVSLAIVETSPRNSLIFHGLRTDLGVVKIAYPHVNEHNQI